MNRYYVTIKDIDTWTIVLTAKGSIAAENEALRLYASAGDRGDHFDTDSDQTIQTEEL
jgi:hypothetical protein